MDMLSRFMGIGKPRQLPAQAFPEDDIYPLHLQDYNFRRLLMVSTMRFDDVLDAEKLHNALSQLLKIGDWRKLGGRLRSDVSRLTTCHTDGGCQLTRTRTPRDVESWKFMSLHNSRRNDLRSTSRTTYRTR
jgi:hypothetical protein